jgi:hypothetical protein
MSGPRPGSRLLDLLEPGWRRHLASGEPAGALDVEPEMLDAAARALGDISRSQPPATLSRRWPACVVVAVAQVAAWRDKTGRVWPAWHRATGTRATQGSAAEWGKAFLGSLAALGVPAPAGDPVAAVLAHAAAREPAAEAGREGAFARRLCRLEPFGRGVLTCDADPGADLVRDDGGCWVATFPDDATDPADPLLAFDADGEPIAEVLPPEAVWLVHPEDRALRADTAPRVLVESRLPLTWKGWRLVQLDLSGVTWLELDAAGAGGSRPGAPRRHPVRGRSKPWLVTGAAVPGIRTTSGLAVLGTLPAVRLPDSEARWRAEVRRAGSGAVLAVIEASGDRWDPGRLWEPMPRPVLGELVVTVTPLGGAPGTGGEPASGGPASGLRRVVAVAEGLGVGYSPALRLAGDEGLEPAEAVLRPPPGMTVSPCAAAIPPGVTATGVTCVAGPLVLPLQVTPPHWRTRIEPEPGSGDGATAWHSLGPLLLETADLIHGGALRLDLPGTSGSPPIDVVAAAGIVQLLEPSKRGRYPLRRMLDTVRAHGGAELRVTVGARTAVIARISPSAPAADPWLRG